MFTRQPCYPIPRPRDVGQWLCVPPFRMVCPYQAIILAAEDASFTRTPYRWYKASGMAPLVLSSWATMETSKRCLADPCPLAPSPYRSAISVLLRVQRLMSVLNVVANEGSSLGNRGESVRDAL